MIKEEFCLAMLKNWVKKNARDATVERPHRSRRRRTAIAWGVAMIATVRTHSQCHCGSPAGVVRVGASWFVSWLY